MLFENVMNIENDAIIGIAICHAQCVIGRGVKAAHIGISADVLYAAAHAVSVRQAAHDSLQEIIILQRDKQR